MTHCPVHIGRLVLEREFRRMHSNHDQAGIFVLRRPGLHIGERPQRVDAGVGPEIDQHNFPAQRFSAQGNRIEPADGPFELWHVPLVAK